MIRHLRTGLMTASILALSSGAAFADYELNILHINDLHSRIESINDSNVVMTSAVCFGFGNKFKRFFYPSYILCTITFYNKNLFSVSA